MFRTLLYIAVFFFSSEALNAKCLPDSESRKSLREVERQTAIATINNLRGMPASAWWPEVDPNLFLDNLLLNVSRPDTIHQGNRTNFCGYAVVTYLYAQRDPLGYTNAMLSLYKRGHSKLIGRTLKPGDRIRAMAGTLRQKGVLSQRPADQMWYLSLADQFRSKLNLLDQNFNRGDENGVWAAMELGKLNKLMKAVFISPVSGRGKGMRISSGTHLAQDIRRRLPEGDVILYADKTFKTKGAKKHLLPTHFLVIIDMKDLENAYEITYWDYAAVKKITLRRRAFERAARGYSVVQLDESGQQGLAVVQ